MIFIYSSYESYLIWPKSNLIQSSLGSPIYLCVRLSICRCVSKYLYMSMNMCKHVPTKFAYNHYVWIAGTRQGQLAKDRSSGSTPWKHGNSVVTASRPFWLCASCPKAQQRVIRQSVLWNMSSLETIQKQIPVRTGTFVKMKSCEPNHPNLSTDTMGILWGVWPLWQLWQQSQEQKILHLQEPTPIQKQIWTLRLQYELWWIFGTGQVTL